MTKKKVFVISHSHWDREWYMAYEKHHMRLISLMDELFHLFETDSRFDSFHLDGQTIILDDYLAVRPDKRAELAHWIETGKLRVGPFYVLQDDYLISAEANLRNAWYGRQEALKWGQPVPLGYFPDTFGNMGQTAQIMQLAGIDTVAFGRGVTPTGFNNQTTGGDYESPYSEMWWQGPDDSKVLAILFANWYSNGVEIPVDRTEAKAFWTKKLADAERFAATDDLLFMNGIDHQPVQQDLTAALDVARDLFPDYEFIHTNFPAYIKQLRADLPKDLSTIQGELTSQATSGWYTLANTASSRIYLKQTNTAVSRLLENQTEPMVALANQWSKSTQDRLDYAWKRLLQNAPHDSICGCSVDPVHRGMMTRYEDAQAVGESLRDDALAAFAAEVDTKAFPADSHPFVVVNTTDTAKNEPLTVRVELARALYADGAPVAQYEKMKALEAKLPQLAVVDETGQIVASRVVDTTVSFNYDLPDDRFRVAYQALYVDIEVAPALLPFSWQSLAVVEATEGGDAATTNAPEETPQGPIALTSQTVDVTVDDFGRVTLTDKQTGRTYADMLQFEDVGDIGNEYIFKEAGDELRVLSGTEPITAVRFTQRIGAQQLDYTQTLRIPRSAAAELLTEQQAVVDITQRHAGRSDALVDWPLHVTLTLNETSGQLEVYVAGVNKAKDHRLRALVKTGLSAATHTAESIYEVVTRPNRPANTWENPTDPQHMQAFVSLASDDAGIVVGSHGLNEYEVLADTGTLAVTLLRSVGEMGDWGYFPTPEAQCLGDWHAAFSIQATDGSENAQLTAYHRARAAQVPLLAQQTTVHAGSKPAATQYLTISAPAFAVTATMPAPDGEGTVVRGYNLCSASVPLQVQLGTEQPVALIDGNGRVLSPEVDQPLRPAEIRTYKFD